jgi:hypothetical protein
MLLSTAVNPDEGEAYGATVYGVCYYARLTTIACCSHILHDALQ